MIFENEEWKEIIGYEETYLISNYGKIKSKERININSFGWVRTLKERILKPENKKGYFRICFNGKHFFVHRLVGLHFLEYVKGKPFINHKDGDKQNNFYKNLEWCTQQENNIHSIQVLGKPILRGEMVGGSKLTSNQILAIRKSKQTQKQLAEKHNVCFQTISNIINRKTWKHVQ